MEAPVKNPLYRTLAAWTPTEDGAAAERAAELYLRGLGYRILGRNVRAGGGEIDLVAVEGDTLCFVEVKARRSGTHGRAVEAVGRDKRRRIERAANGYLVLHPWAGPCRIDVVGVEPGSGGANRFELLRNAFEAGGDGR